MARAEKILEAILNPREELRHIFNRTAINDLKAQLAYLGSQILANKVNILKLGLFQLRSLKTLGFGKKIYFNIINSRGSNYHIIPSGGTTVRSGQITIAIDIGAPPQVWERALRTNFQREIAEIVETLQHEMTHRLQRERDPTLKAKIKARQPSTPFGRLTSKPSGLVASLQRSAYRGPDTTKQYLGRPEEIMAYASGIAKLIKAGQMQTATASLNRYVFRFPPNDPIYKRFMKHLTAYLIDFGYTPTEAGVVIRKLVGGLR